MTALNQLRVGAIGIVEGLSLPDEVQHHLMHMGFVPEARVMAVRRAPAGDPTVYAIDGFEIALRRETARGILISVEDPSHALDGKAEAGLGARLRSRFRRNSGAETSAAGPSKDGKATR